MEDMSDPYDMLNYAHERIKALEISLNNMRIQNQRNESNIQVLLESMQVLQNSQIVILEKLDN